MKLAGYISIGLMCEMQLFFDNRYNVVQFKLHNLKVFVFGVSTGWGNVSTAPLEEKKFLNLFKVVQ